jgi:hypothetical protein
MVCEHEIVLEGDHLLQEWTARHKEDTGDEANK